MSNGRGGRATIGTTARWSRSACGIVTATKLLVIAVGMVVLLPMIASVLA